MADKLRLRPELIGLHSMNNFIHHNSSPRGYMSSSHLSQIITIENGDEKILQTGLERELGKYNFNIELDCDARFIRKIDRYKGMDKPVESLIIFENLDKNIIDCIVVPYNSDYHTYFGFKYVKDSKLLDNLYTNEIIEKNTKLAVTPTYRESCGYAFGANLNMCKLTINEVADDPCLISERAAKKMKYRIFEKRVVEFGLDSIPLNLYGDENNYKTFPEIGEYIHETGVLMATRKIDTMLSPGLLSKKDVLSFDPIYDNAIYCRPGKGKIVDIKAYYNANNRKKSRIESTFNGIMKYVNMLDMFYNDIIRLYEDLNEDYKKKFNTNNDLLVSDRFHAIIVEAYNNYNATHSKRRIKRLYKRTPLDLFRLEFTIEYEMTPKIGSKLTTLHGSKAIIAEVVPDELMPIDKDGNRADIIMDPGSDISRMNIGNNYEQAIGAVSRKCKKIVSDKFKSKHGDNIEAIYKIDDTEVNELFNIILGLLKIVSPKQFTYYTNLSVNERREVLKETITKELYIYLPVDNEIENMDIIDMVKDTIYMPPLSNIELTDNNGNIIANGDDVLIGPMNIILLSKIADTYLCTSSAKVNSFGLPIGVNKQNKHSLPWRNSPTKIISETEFRLHAAYVSPEYLAEMKDRATSLETHYAMYHNILTAPQPTNIDRVVDRNTIPYGNDKSLKWINTILRSAGVKFKYEKPDYSGY